MNKSTFSLFESYMLSCMEDSAHDKEHIYRVLYNALDIANSEENVDYNVLICACLLHDIGRKEQFEDPSLCHAEVGSNKAYKFLTDNGFSNDFSAKVRDCIRTHRFRKSDPPSSTEAKILFDADKIDVAGALGIARTLIYKGKMGQPIYSLSPDGSISDGTNDQAFSFFQEYKYKLENLYSHFYTKRGHDIAQSRRSAAKSFYESIFKEVETAHDLGVKYLKNIIDN